LHNVYYPKDLAKEPIGVIFYKDKFHQFFHSTTTGNLYLRAVLKEVNKYKFQDDGSTEEEEQRAEEELYRSVTWWSKLIKDNQEAPKEPKNLGPQTGRPPLTLSSLLPYILLSRYNRNYQWPQKLSQGHLQRASCNTRSLKNWPNHLKDLDKELDLFLLELNNLDPANTVMSRSVLLLPMHSEDTFNPDKAEEVKEVEETLLVMINSEGDLLMKSPMVTTSRIWSPFPRPTMLKLWDHSLKFLMEIELRLKPSSPNSLDNSCSTMES
jgi:hypothetical protein